MYIDLQSHTKSHENMPLFILLRVASGMFQTWSLLLYRLIAEAWRGRWPLQASAVRCGGGEAAPTPHHNSWMPVSDLAHAIDQCDVLAHRLLGRSAFELGPGIV